MFNEIFVSSVNLKVENLESSVEFYRNLLGFKILHKDERSASFTVNGKDSVLRVEQPAGVLPKQRRTTGLYHFALLLPRREDLGRFLRYMIEKGYPIQGASDHSVSEALYFSDPDGNGIEVYRDRPSSEWERVGRQVVMTTLPMDVEGVLNSSGKTKWDGFPAETRMGHVHLHVSDLQKDLEVYKALGFEVMQRLGNHAVFMAAEGYHHHIALNTWNGTGAQPPDVSSAGLKFFTVLFANNQKREQAFTALEKSGASVWEEDGEKFTEDFSGNRINLSLHK